MLYKTSIKIKYKGITYMEKCMVFMFKYGVYSKSNHYQIRCSNAFWKVNVIVFMICATSQSFSIVSTIRLVQYLIKTKQTGSSYDGDTQPFFSIILHSAHSMSIQQILLCLDHGLKNNTRFTRFFNPMKKKSVRWRHCQSGIGGP